MVTCNSLNLFRLSKTALFFTVISIGLTVSCCSILEDETSIAMEELAYPKNALEPYISAETMHLHYGKHYAGYVAASNRLLKKSPFSGKPITEIIALSSSDSQYANIFNNVAQAWNHSFFWRSIKPGGGGIPQGVLAKKIDEDFGGFGKFKEAFLAEAGKHFGSGWVWLVDDGEGLKILTTSNADTPIAHGLHPIFGVDLWEHAYYLDYQNRRNDFVKTVLDNLADWDFAASRMERHPHDSR
jgi:Fe-Mn family superoxide dismutase